MPGYVNPLPVRLRRAGDYHVLCLEYCGLDTRDDGEISGSNEHGTFYPGRDRRVIVVLMVTSVALSWSCHPRILIASQGDVMAITPQTFYALMTMHGLGMAGTLFSAGIAMVWYVAARHARPSRLAMWIAWALFLAGGLALLAATLIGKFAAGWYTLYPLPFLKATWPGWSTGLTIVSLMAMGVGWLVALLDILRALAVEHGIARMFAWDRFGAGAGREAAPAGVLIGAVCAVAGVLGTIVGAASLMMYLFQWFAPATQFDPLLLKTALFSSAHDVNVAMYCGIGVVYELCPAHRRPWKVTKAVAVA